MRDKSKVQESLDKLGANQRRAQQSRILVGPEVTLNRITFDAQGRIVYGADGTIALSAEGS